MEQAHQDLEPARKELGLATTEPTLNVGDSQQADQVAECQVESVNRDNNSIMPNTSKPQQQGSTGLLTLEAPAAAAGAPPSVPTSSSDGNANEDHATTKCSAR